MKNHPTCISNTSSVVERGAEGTPALSSATASGATKTVPPPLPDEPNTSPSMSLTASFAGGDRLTLFDEDGLMHVSTRSDASSLTARFFPVDGSDIPGALQLQ